MRCYILILTAMMPLCCWANVCNVEVTTTEESTTLVNAQLETDEVNVSPTNVTAPKIIVASTTVANNIEEATETTITRTIPTTDLSSVDFGTNVKETTTSAFIDRTTPAATPERSLSSSDNCKIDEQPSTTSSTVAAALTTEKSTFSTTTVQPPTTYNMSAQYGSMVYDDIQLICISSNNYPSLENKLDKLMMQVKNGERLTKNVYVDNIPADRYRAYSVLVKKVVEHVQYGNTNNLPLWYIFDGMGAQWVGMADDLMKIPTCNRTFNRLHQTLEVEDYDLLGTLQSTNMSTYDSILNVFTCITAVQIALVDFLRSVDIYPSGMIGHSVGEIACAYADGVLTADEAILTSYFRGRSVIEAKLPAGSMAIIGLAVEWLEKKLPKDRAIRVACHNGQENVVISGLTNDVNVFVSLLKADKVFAREFRSHGIAFNSEYVKDAGPIYMQYLQKVIKTPRPRTDRWISSSSDKTRWNSPTVRYCGPDYFVDNLINPVLFHEASMYLPRRAVILEIGPHNILQSTLKRTLNKKSIILSLLRKVNARNLAYMMSTIGKFYISGGRFKVTEAD